MLQVLTANRLSDGEVVYLGAAGGWVEGLDGALLLGSPAESDAALAKGATAEAEQKIVNAYLFDVTDTGASRKPVKMREIIRATGPTVRRDLGKQARA
jgi:hypothetical protein